MAQLQTKSRILALIMLSTMAGMLFISILNESAIVDELAHIPAGYSYSVLLDYRLNPEHPPLLKAISGAFVYLFTNAHFPKNIASWKSEINGQWGMGYSFLYDNGNNADAIIFWARLPVILLAICFGWLLYQWVNKKFGSRTALLTLAFFCFSPTILAHSRYVTTDIGASFGFFIGIAAFIQLLQRPTARNAVIAGFCFAIAQLLKFSLVLLVPMYGLMFIVWIISMRAQNKKEWLRSAWMLLIKIKLMFITALVLIWAVYGVFTYNYPPERQLNDATYILTSYGFRPTVNLDLWLIARPVTRPLGQYLLGVLMVQQRAAGGNTAYFLGEVSAAGSRLYFPLLYLVKEPLPIHLFSLIALVYVIAQFHSWFKGRKQTVLQRVVTWREVIQNHFVEWSCVIMIAVYWAISMKSPLNIGIRHVLPTFPFIYILTARGIMGWIYSSYQSIPIGWKEIIMRIIFLSKTTTLSKIATRYAITILFLFWLIAGTVFSAPYFLSFYNELAGNTPQGWRIAVDSNYDWGQDLKRLADFVQTNNIEKIAVDYFGGGVPKYYLDDKVEPWWSSRGQPKGWFAISATFRQGAFGAPAPGFIRKQEDSYEWLTKYPPIARAGYSIFIYKLPE